ncbi:hypothetical protein BGW39_000122 [Mortierella sp. 14UC]|nr:hypothetical protein BGW39_000122 [Mortierella sp. 14UC]
MSLATTTPTTDDDSRYFKCISMLPEKFDPAAAQVAQFIEQFVNVSTQNGVTTTLFSWATMMATYYQKRDTDLALIKYDITTVASQKSETTAIAHSVTEFLKKALGVDFPADSEESLKTHLSTVFSGVKTEKDETLWGFTYSENGQNKGFQYSVLAHVPITDEKDSFLVLILTFFIKVDIEKTGGWFWESIYECYSVEVAGAKFKVRDTYIANR